MRANQALLCCGLLVGVVFSCAAQPISCGAVAPEVRDSVRAAGACDDGAGVRRPVARPRADSPITAARQDKATSPRGAAAAPKSARGARTEVRPVPNVVGATIDEAEARLSGFMLERVDQVAQAPAGQVVAQEPSAASMVAPGSRIRLVVSSGPPTVALPNVVERSFDDARDALSAFTVARIVVPGAAPAGQVVRQQPAAGASMLPGSTVQLQVSDGSLARASIDAPVIAAPTTAPLPADRFLFADPRITALVAAASLLLGIGLGALSMRRWLLRRSPPVAADTALPSPPAVDATSSDIAERAAPPARFFARLDAGAISISFGSVADEPEPAEEYAGRP